MIHIGKIIKQVVKERGFTITEFGKRISTHRRNVYDIFERESFDTALLQKISKVLEHDFFSYFEQNHTNETIVSNKSATNYKKTGSNKPNNELLLEKIENCQKEIEYLKQLVKEKDIIISLLGKKK